MRFARALLSKRPLSAVFANPYRKYHMKNNFFSTTMRNAAHLLMSDGGQKVSATLREALKNMPLPMNPTASIQPMPDLMRNLALKMGKPIGAASGKDGIPEFVTELLTRLGTLPHSNDGQIAQNEYAPEPWTQPIAEPEPATRTNGQFLCKTFTNHAGTRDYKVYVPSMYAGQALPVMVMLHGCSQNPDDFARGTRMNTLAEERHCFVVYPAQTSSANSSKCWNWFNAIDQQRDHGEPSIIAGITQQVIDDYAVDTKRVYIAGLSSGGAMAIIMGTTYPDIYAAVGVHSGLPYGAAQDLPSALSAMRGAAPQRHSMQGSASKANARLAAIPIIVFHGDQDTVVNIKNSDQLMQQNVSAQPGNSPASENRLNLNVIVQEGKIPNGHAYTCTSHHDENGDAVAEHWVVHGAGHAWAGGSKNGSYTDGKGPDASGEMMRFFFTHPKAV